MRPPSRVARRYASALFHAARRGNVADGVAADLHAMADIFDGHPQVLEAMAVPRVPAERKKAVLQAIVGERMKEPVTRRFLDLVVDHGRENALPDTVAAYTLLADEANGVVNAEVRSATPLDAGQTARLKARLDSLTGRDTRLTLDTDASLVGGIIVRIGDTVMDGSVKGYLEQIGNRLRTTPMPAIG